MRKFSFSRLKESERELRLILNFRDVMAGIPSCVGVVSIKRDEHLFGCTISSFISLSVDQGAEKVLFVLKSDSQTGLRLKDGHNFTVSILNANQSEIARVAGSGLPPDELTQFLIENSESSSSGLSIIRDCIIGFELLLEQSISVENAELFICKVLGVHLTQSDYSAPMVYLKRRFGYFEPNA
jgi:hypothetical protein